MNNAQKQEQYMEAMLLCTRIYDQLANRDDVREYTDIVRVEVSHSEHQYIRLIMSKGQSSVSKMFDIASTKLAGDELFLIKLAVDQMINALSRDWVGASMKDKQ